MNRFREGQSYEQAAAERLTAKGWQILERNWRRHHTELDIIALDGKWLVFVEVKYRSSGSLQSPLEAVDRRKRVNICRTAAAYMLEKGIPADRPVRFDIVACGPRSMQLYKNAFDFSM